MPDSTAIATGSPSNGMLPQSDSQSVLDILLAEHAITQAQADEIKVKSAMQAQSFETALINAKVVPEEKIAEAKAKILGVPFISLVNTSFSPEALNLVPRVVAERFSLIPFMYDPKARILSVAMSNP